jgi:hypothetical protein
VRLREIGRRSITKDVPAEMSGQETVFRESGNVHRQSSPAQPFSSRLLFIDNLRWTMIILVISMHAADTYSPLGNWYYVDRRPMSAAALFTFAAWQMYLQSFFMGLLFFIAGFFVPASFDRKGPLQFVRERTFRLGVPVLFYMFVLGPVTEYFCSHSWNSTEPTSFANEWVKHIRNAEFLQENGPLWFCLALLIFSVMYVVFRALRSTTKDNNNEGTQPPTPVRWLGLLLPWPPSRFSCALSCRLAPRF